MTLPISSAARTRLALVAFASLWLSACGGGGGGDTVAAAPSPLPAASGAPAPGAGTPSTSAPTGGPATSPSPAAGPSAGASQFVAFGPSTVVSRLPPSPPAHSSDVARLNAGGGVTVWTDGKTVQVQRFDAGGSANGSPITVASDTNGVSLPRVAQLTGGGWAVVWKASYPPYPFNTFSRFPTAKLQFKRFAADGTPVQDTTEIESAIGIGGFDVKGTADGGFAVASSIVPGPIDSEVVVQRFDANGALVAKPQARLPAGMNLSTNGGEIDPWLVALPDNSLEMLWFRKIAGTTQGKVWMQHFDAQSAPIGDAVAFEQTLQDGVDAAGSGTGFAAAVLSDGRIALTWSEILGANPTPLRQFWLIADQAGAVQTPVGAMSVGRIIEGVAVAPDASGGFTLFSQLSDAAQGPALAVQESIGVLSVNDQGAAQGTWATLVSRLTVGPNNGPVDAAYSVAGGPDGHYVVSFQQAVAPNGGQLDVLGK